MKKIHIKICDYDASDPCSYGVFIMKILQKYYNVVLSDNPEYIFYNESSSEHLNYDCIKIWYTGENIHSNFNFCDYAIGSDYMDFGDRYYRLPIYLVSTFYQEKELALEKSHNYKARLHFTKDDLAKKTEFCSFVYSNYLGESARETFFKKLSAYKKVNAGGAYLNNIGERTDNKLAFELKHKFSIAFENSSRSGYTTEKLPTALAAQTIPIYWGNPEIGKEFNEKRFINCHAYNSFDQVVERVKEIDNDDELYLSIINESPVTEYDFDKVRNDVDSFLKNIIDRPLSEARRRHINPVRAKQLEKSEKLVARQLKKETRRKRFLASLYRPFKRIAFLEKLKERYFIMTSLKK